MPQNLGPIDESLSVPTKQYVDDLAATTGDGRFLPLAGGRMAGNIDMDWRSILMVWETQTAVLSPIPGMNGEGISGPSPTNQDHLTTKEYVDGTLQVYSGSVRPTNPNILIWIDTGA